MNRGGSEQQSYYEPTINAVHADAPPDMGCPSENEDPHFSNEFVANETIYFATYYRDQLANEVSTHTIRDPNGIVYDTWDNSSSSFFSLSWWYWTGFLTDEEPGGTWTFEVEFDGQIVIHEFEFLNFTDIDESTNTLTLSVYPNPSSDKLFVYGLEGEKCNYSIKNIDGKIVKSGTNTDALIDISILANGVYFVFIDINGEIITDRFVKD